MNKAPAGAQTDPRCRVVNQWSSDISELLLRVPTRPGLVAGMLRWMRVSGPSSATARRLPPEPQIARHSAIALSTVALLRTA